MPTIVLTPSAIDKLNNDPKVRQWRRERSSPQVPSLRYYRRSYATAHDGTITEYGDGFALTTIDPDDHLETEGIVIKTVAVSIDLDILVGGDEEIMSKSFTIGWTKKFTFEPRASD